MNITNYKITPEQLAEDEKQEMFNVTKSGAFAEWSGFRITHYKITPQQMCEIESHLELASYILNSEDIPDWEDLQTACRQIWDAREDLRAIKEKVKTVAV